MPSPQGEVSAQPYPVMRQQVEIEKAAKIHQKRPENFEGSIISLTAYQNDGYECKLLRRSGSVGLFEQLTHTGKCVAYELIIVQSYRGHEHAPGTEDWGRLGWSFAKYENAINAFRKMTEAPE
jgi:hypothetical protein